MVPIREEADLPTGRHILSLTRSLESKFAQRMIRYVSNQRYAVFN